MHFWIDKRSQACGFGRARVAASLSGNNLGFGHHPRRIGGKSMVTPIHRFQAVDCRPHVPRPSQPANHHHHQQQQPSSAHHHQTQNHTSSSHSTSHHSSQSQQTQHSANNYNNHHRSAQAQTHHAAGNHSVQQHHQHQLQQQQQQQQQQLQHQQQQQQLQQQQQQQLQHQQHLQQQLILQQQYQHQQNQPYLHRGDQPHLAEDCDQIVSLQHFQSTHNIDLDHSPMGLALSSTLSRPQLSLSSQQGESQLLPSHLKCGMWASLALATVFVAGAKFYFDHQGTGLEVLIFCAFSATFFLAACTVSLCRRPRDLNVPSVLSDSDQINRLEPTLPQTTAPNNEITSAENVAPPPPYHIAILLPETDKEAEEIPPPSYDKILI